MAEIKRYILKRLEVLAEQAKPLAKPNPGVSALVVQNREILSEGRTQETKHAEVQALEGLKKIQKYSAKEADLYISLTPCSFYGKTPPCTDAIIKSGIRYVHAALYDPDERLQAEGDSVALLAKQGIKLSYSFPLEYCLRIFFLNIDYFFRQRYKQPFVTLKYAMTLDGRMAALDGRSKWISSLAARSAAAKQRALVDVVWIGARTFLLDNPRLKAEAKPQEKLSEKQRKQSLKGDFPSLKNPAKPLKEPKAIVFLDRDFSEAECQKLLDQKYQLLGSERKRLLWLVQKDFTQALKLAESEGIEIFQYPAKILKQASAFFDFVCLLSAKFSWNSIYVEGGSRTLFRFREAGLFHKADVYMSFSFFRSQAGDGGLIPFSQASLQKKSKQSKKDVDIKAEVSSITDLQLSSIHIENFGNEGLLVRGYTPLAKVTELCQLVIPNFDKQKTKS